MNSVDLSKYNPNMETSDQIVSLLNNRNFKERNDDISKNLGTIQKALVKVNEHTQEDNFFYKLPLVGKTLKNISKSNYERSLDGTKSLVQNLSLEITKQLESLKIEAEQMKDLTKQLHCDLNKNKELFKELKDYLITEENNLDNNSKKIITAKINNLQTLIETQTIQLGNLSIVTSDNDVFMENVKTALHASIISIATGAMINQHLDNLETMNNLVYAVKEAQENICLDISKKTHQHVKNSEKLISYAGMDNKKLTEAINLIRETLNAYEEFNKTKLPNIISNLSKSTDMLEVLHKDIEVYNKSITNVKSLID